MFGVSAGILVFPLLITLIYYNIRIHNNKIKTPKNIILIDVIFIIYCYLLIGQLYFPIEIYYSGENIFRIKYNLTTFAYVFELIGGELSAGALVSILSTVLGNFFAFFPLGLYLSFRSNRKCRDLVFLLVAGIGAEVIQVVLVLITRNADRIADIDDIILNLSGGLIAYYSSVKILNRISLHKKSDQAKENVY